MLIRLPTRQQKKIRMTTQGGMPSFTKDREITWKNMSTRRRGRKRANRINIAMVIMT